MSIKGGGKMKTSKVLEKLYEAVDYDDDGFREVDPLDFTEDFIRRNNIQGAEVIYCRCGSQYCEICNGSYDSDATVIFPDGSEAELANPRQSAFAGWIRAVK